MARPIKHKISYQKYLRVLSRPSTSAMTYKGIKDGKVLTHYVLSAVSDGYVYVNVRDLSKPVKRNENPSYYRYDVARAIVGGK